MVGQPGSAPQRSRPDGQSNGVMARLLELVVVAEHLLEVSPDEPAQPGDGHDIEPASRVQVRPGVAEDDAEHLAADVSGQMAAITSKRTSPGTQLNALDR